MGGSPSRWVCGRPFCYARRQCTRGIVRRCLTLVGVFNCLPRQQAEAFPLRRAMRRPLCARRRPALPRLQRPPTSPRSRRRANSRRGPRGESAGLRGDLFATASPPRDGHPLQRRLPTRTRPLATRIAARCGDHRASSVHGSRVGCGLVNATQSRYQVLPDRAILAWVCDRSDGDHVPVLARPAAKPFSSPLHASSDRSPATRLRSLHWLALPYRSVTEAGSTLR